MERYCKNCKHFGGHDDLGVFVCHRRQELIEGRSLITGKIERRYKGPTLDAHSERNGSFGCGKKAKYWEQA